jgi:hypothetical protein
MCMHTRSAIYNHATLWCTLCAAVVLLFINWMLVKRKKWAWSDLAVWCLVIMPYVRGLIPQLRVSPPFVF